MTMMIEEETLIQTITTQIHNTLDTIHKNHRHELQIIKQQLYQTEEHLREVRTKLRERERKYKELKERSLKYRGAVKDWYEATIVVEKEQQRVGKRMRMDRFKMSHANRSNVVPKEEDLNVHQLHGGQEKEKEGEDEGGLNVKNYGKDSKDKDNIDVKQEKSIVEISVPVINQDISNATSKVKEKEEIVAVNEAEDKSVSIKKRKLVEHSDPNSKNETLTKFKNPLKDNDDFKYQQVIRKQNQRRQLTGHDCPSCRAFFDAICKDANGNDNGQFNRKEMVQECSRHRYKYVPEQTPQGFWELSFVDEKEDCKDVERL